MTNSQRSFDSAGDDVLADAVAEVFLLRVAAHVLERQHGNGRLVGKRQASAGHGRRDELQFRHVLAQAQTIGSHRPRNVFELLVAEIDEFFLQLVAHLFIGRT